jgi:hypothetical protein
MANNIKIVTNVPAHGFFQKPAYSPVYTFECGEKTAFLSSNCRTREASLIFCVMHKNKFAPTPLFEVMGGFHLAGSLFEAIISDTVNDLKEFNLKVIVPGHCRGWRAVHEMLNTFGEEIVLPSAVGRRHLF